MAIIFVSILMGAICGLLGLRVFVVIPLSALFALCGVASGLITHAYSWSAVVAAIASFTGLQLAYYAAVGLILHFSRVKTTIPGMKAAIGQRLGAELEVLPTLPPELSALVARYLEVDGAASLIPTRSLG